MLQDEAVRSAEIYLDYLIEHKDEGLGMVRAQVRSVQSSLLGGEMLLFTDRVMRSAEGLVIRIGGTVYENSDQEEHFKVLSVSRRKVLIAPKEELAAHIEASISSKEPVILETDLTFLVKRVLHWYEKHGDKVRLPSKKPVCALDPDNPISLSDNQYNCARLAMTTPLSYIWGAPGTGKTKHVLTSCVLSYIRAGKKVILVAPTNNALEQSLSGLLHALSLEASMDPVGKIIRLGVPGDAFRRAWPSICEEGATEWLKMDIKEKIDALDNRIREIDEILSGKRDASANELIVSGSIETLKTEKKRCISRKNELLIKSRKLNENRNIAPMLNEFSVVAATVDSCLFRIQPDGAFEPDHIFLDEAGFCNVIKGMTLLGFGKPLTLLGDHMQLPPVFEGENDLLQDPEKKLARLWKISSLYLEDAVVCGSLESFCAYDPVKPPRFERMFKDNLVETYRFGSELAQILAKRIYGSQFNSKSINETKIVFINAPKKPEDKEKDGDGKHRRISHSEAKCARALIEANMNRIGVTMGIITPYRKQRRLLSETMDRLYKKYKREEEDMEDDIVTVHQSQGREWDILLFSITDAFDEMYFTNSRDMNALKLINTAVSRARKMLVLIGDAEDWKGKSGQMISELFAIGTEISENENIVEKVLGKGGTDMTAPWLGNYGSLYMAAAIEGE